MTHTDSLVTFLPCAGFRPVEPASELCSCGWLESDHAQQHAHERGGALASVTPVRRPPRISLPARRAS
jgi:hypothetical protein